LLLLLLCRRRRRRLCPSLSTAGATSNSHAWRHRCPGRIAGGGATAAAAVVAAVDAGEIVVAAAAAGPFPCLNLRKLYTSFMIYCVKEKNGKIHL
jgi:hypothetical protein